MHVLNFSGFFPSKYLFILLDLFFLHRETFHICCQLLFFFLLIDIQRTKSIVTSQEICAFLADSSPETLYNAYSNLVGWCPLSI